MVSSASPAAMSTSAGAAVEVVSRADVAVAEPVFGFEEDVCGLEPVGVSAHGLFGSDRHPSHGDDAGNRKEEEFQINKKLEIREYKLGVRS